MQINDLILREFKPLHTNSTCEKGLEIALDFQISHVPVVDNSIFIGNVSQLNLDENKDDIVVEDIKSMYDYFFLTEHSTVFDAVKEFYIHNTNILPVINDEDVYIGYVIVEDVLSILSKFPLIAEPAAMIKVKIPTKKYALSEITKIVESNNGRLFGAFISAFNEESTEVIVKFNVENITSVGETFERFGYEILEKYYNDDKKNLMNERFDHLMNFLDL